MGKSWHGKDKWKYKNDKNFQKKQKKHKGKTYTPPDQTAPIDGWWMDPGIEESEQ